MRKEEIRSMWVAAILLAIVLIMSIGFAAYATTLHIGGTGSNNLIVKKATWSVHWNQAYQSNAGYLLSANSQSIGTPTIGTDTVSFTTTLNSIGQFAEFTVQAINDGTIDAKLTGITISGLTAEQKNYVTVSVDYGGTVYTTDQTGLNIALAANNGTKDVKVRVEYVEPSQASQLPQADQTISLTIDFDYASV